MSNLITQDLNALRFLMNEDLYLVTESREPEKPGQEEQPAEIILEPTAEVKGSISAELHPKSDTLQQETEISFNYLGENNKYFLIVVEDPTHTNLNSIHKEMILKIMTAKKMELRDLAILNLSQYPGTTFDQLKDFFSPGRIALFGIDPQRLGITGIKSNVAGSFKNTKILASYSLATMSDNVGKKKEFWNVMKAF